MAFKMQSSVPGLMDISDEPQSVLDMYGTKGGDGTFASNCLLARRLAERGSICSSVFIVGAGPFAGVRSPWAKMVETVQRKAAMPTRGFFIKHQF